MLSAAFVVASFVASTFSAPSPSAGNCTVLWEGRIPQDFTPQSFDQDTSPFNNTIFLGQNQTWSEIVQFPDVPPSLFDITSKPVEISISDESIFAFNASLIETGFRRTELVPANNNNTGDITSGITTIHWSILTDSAHPLNYSHEYQIMWHERTDLAADQLALKTGVPFAPAKEDITVTNPKTLRVVGTNFATPEKNVYVVDFDDDVWHNFAVTIGWETNQTQLYYSRDKEPLEMVSNFTNDWAGQGIIHFGFLRLPIGDPDINIAFEGFQAPIDTFEGLVYGGLFVEDSADGCVSLGGQ
ncbi:hypothetical protein K435DRAFT_798729 [Dendrothele bispora CBS 962.96]|uniref:Glycoside hydrolase 131 catalytic N-terminal domain-containing protein n=1 Tax=Dendrothele bispora (strain CBS 962.96) TaxID=1314807 RepID=A0A4S8LYA0_DENBC|nr:hypothetical protein K435DRAFT_798729 [Dendrothele bispora CBS 962.96]